MSTPIIRAGLLAGILFLAASCGEKTEFDPCPRNVVEEYRIDIQEQSVSLPAKVSVFFKVNRIAGGAVGGLGSQHFTIYEKGRNDECERKISAFESNARIVSRQQVFYHSTMLVLDLSGSITGSSLTQLKTAASRFVEEVVPANSDPSYRMGIWWFDGEDVLHPLTPPTSNRNTLLAAISGITANISSDNSTDLYGAVIKSAQLANQAIAQSAQSNILTALSVVIFTDGTDQAGRYARSAAINAVNNSHKSISFLAIGLGGEIDMPTLKAIGKHGTFTVSNQSNLESTFRQVGELVSAEANSYYLFEYCSPKRDGSGKSGLRIEVNVGGKLGSVLTQFDATGFTGGCQ